MQLCSTEIATKGHSMGTENTTFSCEALMAAENLHMQAGLKLSQVSQLTLPAERSIELLILAGLIGGH